MKFILPVFTNEPPQEEVISLKGENYFNLGIISYRFYQMAGWQICLAHLIREAKGPMTPPHLVSAIG